MPLTDRSLTPMAHAAGIFAKRQGLSKDLIRDAHEIEVDSLTLLGDCLRRAPKNTGTAGMGRPVKGNSKRELPKDAPPTRAELGVSLKESMYASRLSELKEKKPKDHAAVRRGEKTVQQVHPEERKRKVHAEVKGAAFLSPPPIRVPVRWFLRYFDGVYF